MMHYRPLLFFCLLIIYLGTSSAVAAEPKLAFDLVPDPRPSVTDIEDPEWRIVGIDFLSCLRRALDGNALSMAKLVMFTKYYGDITETKYPAFPAAMHHPAYWHKWAARFTSEGWALLQEGHAGSSKSESRAYYQDAADAGNTEAMFLASRVIAAESERRKKWFLQGVEQGNPNALSTLAWIYWGEFIDIGVNDIDKDITKSWEYRKKAAAVGDCDSLALLGQCYARGALGFPKDETTAYIYYLLAVHFAKTADDKMVVNYYWANLDTLPERLSPEQLALAKKTAVAWIEAYAAPYTQALEEARQRRSPILEELRRELAPVVQWFAEQDAAARQAREKR